MEDKNQITKIELEELKRKAQTLKPLVRIGKNGINESVITEIKKQVKKHKLIKIKVLKSLIDKESKKEVINKIIDNTGAVLIQATGFTVCVYAKKIS